MWSLKRKQQPSTAKVSGSPAPQGHAMWRVWLVSIATFVLTVLIVLAMFWTVRWGWRQIHHKQKPAPVKTQPASPEADTNRGQPEANNTPSKPSSASSDSATQSSSQTTVSTDANTPTTPTTNTPKLVNTGPESDE